MATPKGRKYLVLEAGKNKQRDSATDDIIFTSVQVGGEGSGAIISYNGTKFDFAGKRLQIGAGVDATDAVTLGQLTTAISNAGQAAATSAGNGLTKSAEGVFAIDLAPNPGLQLSPSEAAAAAGAITPLTNVYRFDRGLFNGDASVPRLQTASDDPTLLQLGKRYSFVVAQNNGTTYAFDADIIGVEPFFYYFGNITGNIFPTVIPNDATPAGLASATYRTAATAGIDGGLAVLLAPSSNLVVDANGLALDPAYVSSVAGQIQQAITDSATTADFGIVKNGLNFSLDLAIDSGLQVVESRAGVPAVTQSASLLTEFAGFVGSVRFARSSNGTVYLIGLGLDEGQRGSLSVALLSGSQTAFVLRPSNGAKYDATGTPNAFLTADILSTEAADFPPGTVGWRFSTFNHGANDPTSGMFLNTFVTADRIIELSPEVPEIDGGVEVLLNPAGSLVKDYDGIAIDPAFIQGQADALAGAIATEVTDRNAAISGLETTLRADLTTVAGAGLTRTGNEFAVDLTDASGLEIIGNVAGSNTTPPPTNFNTMFTGGTVAELIRTGTVGNYVYRIRTDMTNAHKDFIRNSMVPGERTLFRLQNRDDGGDLGPYFEFSAVVGEWFDEAPYSGYYLLNPVDENGSGFAFVPVSPHGSGTWTTFEVQRPATTVPGVDGGLQVKLDGTDLQRGANGLRISAAYTTAQNTARDTAIATAITQGVADGGVIDTRIDQLIDAANPTAGAGLTRTGNEFALAIGDGSLEIGPGTDWAVLVDLKNPEGLGPYLAHMNFMNVNGAFLLVADDTMDATARADLFATEFNGINEPIGFVVQTANGNSYRTEVTIDGYLDAADVTSISGGGLPAGSTAWAFTAPSDPALFNDTAQLFNATAAGYGYPNMATNGGVRVNLDPAGNIVLGGNGLGVDFAGIRGEITAAGVAVTNALNPRITANETAITALQAADVAIRNELEAAIAGFDPKPSVDFATTADLGGATYANGADGVGATLTLGAAPADAILPLGGATLAAGERVLVKNQAVPAENGIYTVTTLTPFVLTRATDFDGNPDGEITRGARTLVGRGPMGGNSYFVSNPIDDATFAIGTPGVGDIIFSMASGPLPTATYGTAGGVSVVPDTGLATNLGALSIVRGEGLAVVPSGNGAGSGTLVVEQSIMLPVLAGQTIAPLSVVILRTDGTIELATAANATDDVVVGIVDARQTDAATTGSVPVVLRTGSILKTAQLYFTGLTPGKKVYVHPSIPGGYTTDVAAFDALPAGSHLYQIGRAVDAGTIIYDPRHIAEL